MKKLKAWFASPAGKRFFNIFYSLGAAIVVIGAMFKVIHFPGANVVFMTGMIIEALVFALSAFDTSSYDSTPVTVASNVDVNDSQSTNPIVGNEPKSNQGTNVISGSGNKYYNGNANTNNQANADLPSSKQGQVNGSPSNITTNTGGGSPSVIVVGGGTTTKNVSGVDDNIASSTKSANTIIHTNNASSGIANLDNSNSHVINNIHTEEYSQSVNDAAQNLEDFSKTIQSLNETSQTLLDTYKQMADAQNINETLNSVRYINDSLSRIKNLYDGAIGDSYMFKEEMSKMTRNIEALNQVYSRLLQAMTNNNSNSGHNPPY